MSRAPTDLRSLARSHTKTGVRVLAQIAADRKQPAAARVSAIGMLFDRGWGRAPATHTGADGSDIKVVIRHIVEGRDVGGDVIDVEPIAIEDQTNTDQTR